MEVNAQLYKAVQALQRIESGDRHYDSRYLAEIARDTLDQINADREVAFRLDNISGGWRD